MFSSNEQSDEVTMPVFRHFTRESLAKIEAHIAEQAAQKSKRDRLKAEGAIGPDCVPEHYSITQHDERLEPDSTLEIGMRLPRNLAPNFPPQLIATPIEDLDKYYENERTFMIISKKKDLYRFSATNSMFILSPFNPLRRIAIYIVVHPAFSFLVMATIFINCLFMTMPSNEFIESSEMIFTLIYTVESFIKVIAMGFILGKFTYLRDPWNWLDFILNALAYITIGVDLGNLSALRTLRTFRALRALNISIPGLKTTRGAVIESLKNLKDVIILTLFSLSVFALLGVQQYMGVLTQKCVRNPDPNLTMSWDEYVSNYSKTEENWLEEDDEYILCGNSSGARYCPSDSTCVQDVGPNPNYGYTTFDSFPWALLSAFRLMTRDFWESLLEMVLKSAGTWHMWFFVVIIFWCSCLAYLILAIVAMSYDESQKKACKQEVSITAEDAALQAAADAAEDEAAAYRFASLDSFDDLSKKQSVVTVVNMKDLTVASDIIEPADGCQSKKSENERDEKEKPLKAKCLQCIDIFCVWDCCVCWVRFQQSLSLIIFDPFMELFITLCVVANILFMAMDHHDMDMDFYQLLHNGNYFFTAVYVIEAVFKLIALSPKYYFCNDWNKFDFIIAALSLIEVVLEGVQGLSVLGAFRLLRVFKLAKSWPTFNLMLSFMTKTTGVGAFGNLTYILGIFIFIFSVVGMRLFGQYYYQNKHRFENGDIPYWNFTDFFHSFMVVFRALCGEWIETMWDCSLVGGWTCIPFFLSIVVIGNLVVLNLFFAFVLSSSVAFIHIRCGPESGLVPSDTGNTKKIQEAFDRFSRASQWLKKVLLQVLKSIRASPSGLTTNEIADQRKELPETVTAKAVVSDSQVSGGELDSDKYADNVEDIILDEYIPDCCPDCCYVRFPFCKRDESEFCVRWNTARKKSYNVAEHQYFEIVTFTMIVISCLALAAEDVYLKERPLLKEILQYMDKVFTAFFLFEMLLKWLAYGLKQYFRNAWCWLSFVVVLVFMFDQVVGIPIFKILRLLLLLRVMATLKQVRGIVNVCVQTIRAMFCLLLVCLTFWLIFAILGVQLMGGKFYSCTDFDNNRLNASFVPSKWDCLEKNFTWTNPSINFDNVLNAYLALFQVATFKGWINIMHNGIDSTGIDQQPEEEISIYMYLYFVHFIIFGYFFTLCVFIGVFIDSFNAYKRKVEGSLEMYMTEDQLIYYKAMKKMDSKKPAKAIPRPEFKLQAMAFDLTRNKKFDMVIMIFICMNMLVIAMEHYQPSPLYDTILERLNTFFIVIFTVECVLKIFGLRKYYFKKPWNVFDFVVVTLSILEIVLKELIAKYYYVSPTILSVVCVAKVGRVLRLGKFLLLSKGIQTLMHVLAVSLPDLINICLLHYLIMFSYAIFGMFFFMNVRHRAGINQNFNFETFGQSMILLFQLSTSAGWDAVLAAIMEEGDCNRGENGDCGSHNIAVAYLVSYLIVSFLIIIMYIAVIIKNYKQAMEDEQEGLTEVYDMYYEVWQKFDPDATQFITYSALSSFLDSLEEPLRIPKPNMCKIITMDIPICEGELVFCVNILDALTKDFFQRKGRHIDESAELDVVPKVIEGYNPISSTLNRQREIYAARSIQLAWRRYKDNEKEPKVMPVKEVMH